MYLFFNPPEDLHIENIPILIHVLTKFDFIIIVIRNSFTFIAPRISPLKKPELTPDLLFLFFFMCPVCARPFTLIVSRIV